MFFPMQKTSQSMYYLCYGGSGDIPFVLGKRTIRTFRKPSVVCHCSRKVDFGVSDCVSARQ